jgi:hypothetical protein
MFPLSCNKEGNGTFVATAFVFWFCCNEEGDNNEPSSSFVVLL